MAVGKAWQAVLDWVWDEKTWLPSNVTWERVEQQANYPRIGDLYLAIPLAMILMGVRYLIERLVFVPVAHYYGVTKQERTIKKNELLEKAYTTKSTSVTQIPSLASELNWPEAKVRAWLNQRRQLWKPGKFQKLKECGWRATYYACMFTYGLTSLWGKSWFWNPMECWSEHFLYHEVDPEIRNLYLIELAFYLSLIFSQFTDIKRKDFWQMMVHHIATVIAIGGSWIVNGVRLGSLILLCHDAADIPMEVAKVLKYIGKRRLCDVMFVVFLCTWFPTRLGIFPFKLMRAGLEESGKYLAPAPYYILNGTMVILFILHIMWSWMILQIVHRVLIQGELDDVRSDTEDSEDEQQQPGKKET